MEALSLPVLIAIFILAAMIVWQAGARLATYASEISDRTGMSQAVIGVLLLGGATSLPEIATSSVATLAGNANMAVNNLLGGVAFQLVVLALADMVVGRGALTSMVPGPRVLISSTVCIVLLALTSVGVMVNDWPLPFAQIGLFPLLIAATYCGGLWLLHQEGATTGWRVTDPDQLPDELESQVGLTTRKLTVLSLFAAALILAGGTALTLSAEAIAGNLGIDLGIAGLTFLAVATSLPEISTAIAAVRLRQAELAIGDVLGGNMFDIALLLLVDILHTGGLALQEVDRSSLAMAQIGILLTGLLLLGLIERRDKAVLRVGYDMATVVVIYLFGVLLIIFGLSD